jgi:hypothetical protein
MNLVDTLAESFNRSIATLVEAIPTILGAILVLVVGLIVGRLVGRVVTTLLERVNTDRWFQRYAGDVYGQTTGTLRPSRVIGLLAKWLIYVVFFIAAANFLNWPQVSTLLNEFLTWLPNLVVAVVILIAAPVLGRLLRGAIASSSGGMGLTNATILGRIAEIAVIAFAVIIALHQVGIASDLVSTLFAGLVAALALAFGLAFGLGGRDVAAEITRAAYDRSRAVSERPSVARQTGSGAASTEG